MAPRVSASLASSAFLQHHLQAPAIGELPSPAELLEETQLPELRMPAEWEPHAATLLAWPSHEEGIDDPNWLLVSWTILEVLRVLSRFEKIELLCRSEDEREHILALTSALGIDSDSFTVRCAQYRRLWLRDTTPTAVHTEEGKVAWVSWGFNAWGSGTEEEEVAFAPADLPDAAEQTLFTARRADGRRFFLEGGAIETDGEGTFLVTEQCLLSDTQIRNKGATKEEYENLLARYLGAKKVIWLKGGIAGDTTNGHIDHCARFVGPGKVLVAIENRPGDENYEVTQENLRRLSEETDALGRPLELVTLPFPEPISFDGEPIPANYLNFYAANRVVLVPTYNDVHDHLALSTFRTLFPERSVIGIASRNLIFAGGSLHCITQQQPLPSNQTVRIRHEPEFLVSSLHIEEAEGKGKGVFTTTAIEAGQTVLLFGGEVLARSEVTDISRALQIGRHAFIDSTGNMDDLINHSCDPNCALRNFGGRIGLIAMRPIEAGEEITFDYSTSMSDENRWVMQCACEATCCRGLIEDFDYLPEQTKERYLRQNAVPGFVLLK